MKSLRTKLLVWYIGSLFVLAVFFYLVVHILQLPYDNEYFILLFIVLAIFGFFITYSITRSITELTSQIRQISIKTLGKRIRITAGEDEIGQLGHAFNNLLDRLNKAFRREEQFIADVTHEMKTPITTMQSMFEVALTKKRTTGEYEKVLRNAVEETARITNTLNNVLNLAWAETPGEQNKLVRCNLSELVKELSDLGEKMALSKKVRISSAVEENIFINGNREKLARALLNLIDNAIKYTGRGGYIYINLAREPKDAVFSIKDNGQGIAKEDLPRIFNRFYRGSKTGRTLGSGLGLAISESIIRLHKGTIRVNSKPGKGSEFTVSIPLVE